MTFAIILFIGLFLGINPRRDTKKASFLFFLIIFLYAGLRFRVGTDTCAYMSVFEMVDCINDVSLANLAFINMEPLSYLLMSLCKTIWNDFLFYQLVVAFLLNYAFYRFFKMNSDSVCLCLFFYMVTVYLMLNCEFLRQAVGISVFYLLVYPMLKKKKYALYVLGCIACGFFHSTLFFTVILIFIDRFNLKYKTVLWGCLVLTALSINIPIIDLLSHYAFGGFLDSKIGAYNSASGWVVGHNFNFYILKSINVAIPLFLLSKNKEFKYTNYVFLYILAYIFGLNNDIFERIMYIFSPFFILLIVDTYKVKCKTNIAKKGSELALMLLLTIGPTTIQLMHNLGGNTYTWQKFFPYYSYLDKNRYMPREYMQTGDEKVLHMFRN